MLQKPNPQHTTTTDAHGLISLRVLRSDLMHDLPSELLIGMPLSCAQHAQQPQPEHTAPIMSVGTAAIGFAAITTHTFCGDGMR
tara:strand:- start:169 stop:420 length:252 start_codon:yes stop_codon:yes gene_type:complete